MKLGMLQIKTFVLEMSAESEKKVYFEMKKSEQYKTTDQLNGTELKFGGWGNII